MKFYLIIGSMLLCNMTFAQQELTLGSNKKYMYYQVVADSASSKDNLINRAKAFFEQKTTDNLKIIAAKDSSIRAEGVFVIDKTILIASHPSGEVSYLFNFDAKDGKYRFWLTNFVFIPYHRNRYGNFVTGTNFGKPLEANVSALQAAEWKSILSASGLKAKEMADSFKKFISAKPTKRPKQNPPTVSLKNKW